MLDMNFFHHNERKKDPLITDYYIYYYTIELACCVGKVSHRPQSHWLGSRFLQEAMYFCGLLS